MRNKKIIHLSYSDHIGGASIAAKNIYNCLNKKISSKFVCEEKRISKVSLYNKFLKKLRIFIGRIPKIFYINETGVNYSFAFLPSKYPKVLNKNSNHNEILHLHWINRETISIEDILKINCKILWTCHDMWPFLGARHIANKKINYKKFSTIKKYFSLDYLTWKRKKKLFLKKKINFVAPSFWMKLQLLKSDLYNKNKIFVIGNPIDCDFWKKINKKIALKKLKLKNNTFKIVFGASGMINDKNKGFDLALKIFERLNKLNIVKFEVLFFGDNISSLDKKINFSYKSYGWVNKTKLREIFSASDLMICTSKIESFCQVVAEAQSCSLPVIAYKTSGLNDVVKNNFSGILVNQYHDKYFLKSIINVIKSKKDMLNFSKNSRIHIKKNFDKKIISEKYLKAYNLI